MGKWEPEPGFEEQIQGLRLATAGTVAAILKAMFSEPEIEEIQDAVKTAMEDGWTIEAAWREVGGDG